MKVAEYLACGLPVIINAGVGDSDTLIDEQKVGAVVAEFNHDEYGKAIAVLESFAPDATRMRTREVARQFFDVQRIGAPRYARLYENVLGNTD